MAKAGRERGPIEIVDLAEFTAEAEALARDATILRAGGRGEPVAYWHGLQAAPCVSLRRGADWLNVHLRDDTGGVEITDEPAVSSTPLFARSVQSLPPVDVVFRFGSERIGEFLRQFGWERSDGFNENFPSSIPAEYERTWQENCPMYARDLYAACGGWPFPWADEDYLEFAESELVIWTLRDAEPWVEVFETDGRFDVLQRVT